MIFAYSIRPLCHPKYIHVEVRASRSTSAAEEGDTVFDAKSSSLLVAAAKRVAKKMETELGDLGGYAIRFEDVTGHSTKT
ncbi:hypothetical protein Tco_0664721 [Tanacetum coccineum]